MDQGLLPATIWIGGHTRRPHSVPNCMYQEGQLLAQSPEDERPHKKLTRVISAILLQQGKLFMAKFPKCRVQENCLSGIQMLIPRDSDSVGLH